MGTHEERVNSKTVKDRRGNRPQVCITSWRKVPSQADFAVQYLAI